jgi:hypothetical protein
MEQRCGDIHVPPKNLSQGTDEMQSIEAVILFTKGEEGQGVRPRPCGAAGADVWSYFGEVFRGVCSSGRTPVVSGPVMLVIDAADVEPPGAVNQPRDR